MISQAEYAVQKYNDSAFLEEANLALLELELEYYGDDRKTERNLAEYVSSQNRETTNGKIYCEENVYYYSSNEGRTIELVPTQRSLVVK